MVKSPYAPDECCPVCGGTLTEDGSVVSCPDCFFAHGGISQVWHDDGEVEIGIDPPFGQGQRRPHCPSCGRFMGFESNNPLTYRCSDTECGAGLIWRGPLDIELLDGED